MSLQLMNKINDNYLIAVVAHNELSDVFNFVGLKGFSLWNEFQRMTESLSQRKVKQYIISTYSTYTPDKLPPSASIAEPLISGKNRKTLKAEETWSIIKQAFTAYQNWEEATLKLYQKTSKELFDGGETAASNFVDELVKDVKSELDYLNDKIIELNAMEWDLSQIVAEQAEYFERYEYLIKNTFGKSENFHHWNSALDSESRLFFEKSPKKS